MFINDFLYRLKLEFQYVDADLHDGKTFWFYINSGMNYCFL